MWQEEEWRQTMKRFVTVLAALSLFVATMAPSASAEHPVYGWTISASNTDPYMNWGSFSFGLLILKLWYACDENDGTLGAEFDIVSMNPNNVILEFVEKSGFVNHGSGTTLLLQVGECAYAPINVMDIHVFSTVPGQYCFAPSSMNGWKQAVDCQEPVPEIWPIQWIGYSNDDNPPCNKKFDGCLKQPVAVEDGSWGRIKSIYR
jgi:hypothetical protein